MSIRLNYRFVPASITGNGVGRVSTIEPYSHQKSAPEGGFLIVPLLTSVGQERTVNPSEMPITTSMTISGPENTVRCGVFVASDSQLQMYKFKPPLLLPEHQNSSNW